MAPGILQIGLVEIQAATLVDPHSVAVSVRRAGDGVRLEGVEVEELLDLLAGELGVRVGLQPHVQPQPVTLVLADLADPLPHLGGVGGRPPAHFIEDGLPAVEVPDLVRLEAGQGRIGVGPEAGVDQPIMGGPQLVIDPGCPLRIVD